MGRESGTLQRPELPPVSDATKRVREPFVIVKAVATAAIQEARKATADQEKDEQRPAR